MKKFILVFVLVLFLVGCGVPAEISSSTNDASSNYNISLIAITENTKIYKFMDGVRVCYFTEGTVNQGGMMSTGAYIWCSQ